MSHQMRRNVNAHCTNLNEEPIETPTRICTVERYRAPFRASYTKIRTQLDSSSTETYCISMDVFAVNSTLGPEGLFPILLVVSTVPHPARKITSANQL